MTGLKFIGTVCAAPSSAAKITSFSSAINYRSARLPVLSGLSEPISFTHEYLYSPRAFLQPTGGVFESSRRTSLFDKICMFRANPLRVTVRTFDSSEETGFEIFAIWRDAIKEIAKKFLVMKKEIDYLESNGHDAVRLRERLPGLLRELRDTLQLQLQSVEKRMTLMKRELDYLEANGMDGSRFRIALKEAAQLRADAKGSLLMVERGQVMSSLKEDTKKVNLGPEPTKELTKLRQEIDAAKEKAKEREARLDSLESMLEELEEKMITMKKKMDEMSQNGDDISRVKEFLVRAIDQRKKLITEIKELEAELAAV